MSAIMPVFDKGLALQRAGGSPDLAQELYTMLLNDLPNVLNMIVSIGPSNPRALLEVVHKLNGATTYCGVPALKSAAHLYETALKMGNSSNPEELHQQLVHEIERVLIAAKESPLF